jgi:hypothetical protein
MKKILITALVGALAAGSVMAQGVVTFTASATTRPIQYTLSADGSSGLVKFAVGSPATAGTYGNLNVAFYSAAAGTTLSTTSIGALAVPSFSGWSIASPILNNIPAQAGGIPSTAITLAQGTATVQFEVVAWTGNYTDFASALAAAELGQALIGWSGSALSGGALSWLDTTGSSLSPAANVVGASGYNGLVLQMVPVPEPGTIALCGLGAAALLLFRRRK